MPFPNSRIVSPHMMQAIPHIFNSRATITRDTITYNSYNEEVRAAAIVLSNVPCYVEPNNSVADELQTL